MKPLRLAVPVAMAALLAACGGSSSSSSDPLADATPTYAALAMDRTAADTSPAALASGSAGLGTALLGAGSDCHPHLFLRTHEVVERVNRHLWKFLRHVERAIARKPTIATGTTEVWESVENGLDRRFTVTRQGDATFSWKLELADTTAASPQFVTVFTGTIDRTGATGPHQGTGQLALDLTALHGVVPAERVQGLVTAAFASTAASRKLEVTAADVTWEVVDASADAATIAALEAPRSGHYVYFREPGTGGSLKIEDQMVFLCPANPGLELADVELVSRWYRLADGSVHGRSDALMTGGQLAAPVANVQGVTCHASPGEASPDAESFWLMKAEDAAGATVAGKAWSSEAAGGATAAACDAAFGPVPDLAGPSGDFDFAAVAFADASVVAFPNMK
ncbi:MAG TPA: hypothetical protein VFP65_20040 [Anaeromyxobacteraceae bacterium]|nr:hypothetical protein [Anaeromyxobacteraceae bacterium]